MASERVRVAGVDELAVGEKRRVRAGGRWLVVGRIGGDDYFALADTCPHQGAELSGGRLTPTCGPTDRVGRYDFDAGALVLRCPWHGFEFDVRTGSHSFVPGSRWRVKAYPVAADGDGVWVDV